MYKADCWKDITTNKRLSNFEARLAFYMFERTDWDNMVHKSQTAIGREMHVTPSQISRATASLIEQGVIRLEERGVYEVNPQYFFMGEDDEREYAVKDRGHLFAQPDNTPELVDA